MQHIQRMCAISTRGNKDISRKGLYDIRSGGIEAIELASDAEVLKSIDFKALQEDARAEDVRIWSLHIPYFGDEHNLIIEGTEERQKVYNTCSDWIKKAAGIGCRCCVIHGGGGSEDSVLRAKQLELSKDMLHRLAEMSHREGITLAVECLPRECVGRTSEEILYFLEGSEYLKVCFDANHLMQNENQCEFIDAIGKNIFTVHISDYDIINERHWMPGEGVIDWKAVMDKLDSINYSHPFVYEVNLEAPCTIERRVLTYTDIKRNFDELHKELPITRIGIPKSRLGMWAPMD